jgi:16S rRNA (uracil1498-N3)-methyltransferase
MEACCPTSYQRTLRVPHVQVFLTDTLSQPWKGPEVHVISGCGSLTCSRADMLIEKCTELGARVFSPLLSERSPTLGKMPKTPVAERADCKSLGPDKSGRRARWQRLVVASLKQSLRIHDMHISDPLSMDGLIQIMAASGTTTFVAAEGGINALEAFADARYHAPRSGGHIASGCMDHAIEDAQTACRTAGKCDGAEEGELWHGDAVLDTGLLERVLLVVGPEGDLSEQELHRLVEQGAVLVSLGPLRLRVETAAVSMLAAYMLHADQHGNAGSS